jgi:predicted TIM-barrel fold metal-dependent hydrolase
VTEAADVRDWWGRLGLSGLVDIHTHFLPPQVMAKVRAQFDAAGPLIGRPWPLTYRDTDDVLVETLRSFGVERFTALAYAHKPGMADWLNRWAADFADRVPEALVSGTFFPEESAAAYVEARLDSVEVFKIHVQVGNFSPLDPLLDQSWGLVAEAGTPVVLHAGSGPVPAAYTGPGPVASLLARHPRLRLVIAHLGAPEYAEFLLLAESHERVHLDTTMAFTDFFSDMGGVFPADLLPRLRDLGLGGKVLLGSDFPNIPYPYLHQLESLTRVELGDDWLRAVAHDNAGALLGLPPI